MERWASSATLLRESGPTGARVGGRLERWASSATLLRESGPTGARVRGVLAPPSAGHESRTMLLMACRGRVRRYIGDRALDFGLLSSSPPIRDWTRWNGGTRPNRARTRWCRSVPGMSFFLPRFRGNHLKFPQLRSSVNLDSNGARSADTRVNRAFPNASKRGDSEVAALALTNELGRRATFKFVRFCH